LTQKGTRKKVVLLTDGVFPHYMGGMPKIARHLSINLPKTGIDLTVIHCVEAGQELISNDRFNRETFPDAEYRLDSICIHYPKRKSYPGHYVVESKAYAERIHNALKGKWDQFDFIYAKGFTGYSLMKSKKSGESISTIVTQLHGLEMFQPTFDLKSKLQSFLLRPIAKYCLQNSDLVFSYDGFIKQKHIELGVDSRRIMSQFGCVPEERWRGDYTPTTGIKKFIFIARNERRKGIPELHRAFEDILEMSFELHIIGPIPDEHRISNKKVIYYEQVESQEVYFSILKACDVLILPSISEGFPTVVLEGMSQGLATIAFNVGAVSAVVNNENGWLIEPTELELASTLKKVIQSSTHKIDKRKQNRPKHYCHD